jgi:RNA polymerase sigma factor (TIGR02999 family)
MRLARDPRFRAESPLHFKRITARAMRRLLIEAARHRQAQKRGNGDIIYVTFDEALAITSGTDTELIALDSALVELALLDPRQVAVVESRFFAGMEFREIATLLNVSEATVMRDWRAARAWLSARLSR